VERKPEIYIIFLFYFYFYERNTISILSLKMNLIFVLFTVWDVPALQVSKKGDNLYSKHIPRNLEGNL
jgi:hypothetical protein